MAWRDEYLQRFYNPAHGWVDGTNEFHRMCADCTPRGGRILEIGAGPNNATSAYLATLGELHGVDPDPSVLGNVHLTRASVLESDRFPYEGDFFDTCVSNYVCEHVADPQAHLAEVRRVLKPGGRYVFRTPNRYHYVSAFSAMTPHWVHALLANKLRAVGPEAHDPYPTHYRMNTRRALLEAARLASLEPEIVRLIEKEPSYGMSSRALFLAFTAYERVVNASEHLAWLRANLFVALRKPLGADMSARSSS